MKVPHFGDNSSPLKQRYIRVHLSLLPMPLSFLLQTCLPGLWSFCFAKQVQRTSPQAQKSRTLNHTSLPALNALHIRVEEAFCCRRACLASGISPSNLSCWAALRVSRRACLASGVSPSNLSCWAALRVSRSLPL